MKGLVPSGARARACTAHLHQRQAAHAGGQQAGALPRRRGHPRRRHHRHRHRGGRHRRGNPADGRQGRALGVNITYIPQEAPLGLAHVVKISQDFWRRPLRDVPGRQRHPGGHQPLIAQFASSEVNSQIVLTRVATPQQYGVAQLDGNGRIVRLVEKPKEPLQRLAWSASTCSTTTSSNRQQHRALVAGELEITDAIQWLVEHGRVVHPYIHSDGGLTPESRAICSKPTAWCWRS